MASDTHRCAICAAEFASSAELVRHERASHTTPGAQTPPKDAEQPADTRREQRVFTRSNKE